MVNKKAYMKSTLDFVGDTLFGAICNTSSKVIGITDIRIEHIQMLDDGELILHLYGDGLPDYCTDDGSSRVALRVVRDENLVLEWKFRDPTDFQ